MGFLVVDPKAGVCDGIYSSEIAAKAIASFLSKRWKGSRFIVEQSKHDAFHDYLYHNTKSGEERLLLLYGYPKEENFFLRGLK